MGLFVRVFGQTEEAVWVCHHGCLPVWGDLIPCLAWVLLEHSSQSCVWVLLCGRGRLTPTTLLGMVVVLGWVLCAAGVPTSRCAGSRALPGDAQPFEVPVLLRLESA